MILVLKDGKVSTIFRDESILDVYRHHIGIDKVVYSSGDFDYDLDIDDPRENMSLSALQEGTLFLFQHIIQMYIEKYYTSGSQRSMEHIFSDNPTSGAVEQINAISDWINVCLTDYYERKAGVAASTTLSGLDAISWDFSNNDDGKPSYSLTTVISANSE